MCSGLEDCQLHCCFHTVDSLKIEDHDRPASLWSSWHNANALRPLANEYLNGGVRMGAGQQPIYSNYLYDCDDARE